MATQSPAGNQLRQRAHDLRRAATHLGGCAANSLYRFSRDDTWIGPTARSCYDELVTMNTSLVNASDALRTAALRLEARADQADHEMVRTLVTAR
jgi:hypothetical protein